MLFLLYVFNTQERHFDIRSILTTFMMLHPTHFSADCHPLPVKSHVHRMQQMSTWGTHAEIGAMALCFNLPVYVTVQKDPDADTLGEILKRG